MIKPLGWGLGAKARYALLVLTFFGCYLARHYHPEWTPAAQGIERVIFTAAAIDILWMVQQWLRQRWAALRQRWETFRRLTDEAPYLEPEAPGVSRETVDATDVSTSV
ncbi:hypothetical protein B7755_032690 [Streptomyces sp. NBS 14/10]|uniref:hypothetical protein n=1 Tax=Streptomyces sp. NBS 14/10 TaxID=1945643 RepID=UPI000B7EAACD|nr:hypothetical protein [Streptomyces sp. NBS 14/10]KAK1182473.1 hypothetical protein B7755_032690 [Streptomyces sp. NBS 14/10]